MIESVDVHVTNHLLYGDVMCRKDHSGVDVSSGGWKDGCVTITLQDMLKASSWNLRWTVNPLPSSQLDSSSIVSSESGCKQQTHTLRS